MRPHDAANLHRKRDIAQSCRNAAASRFSFCPPFVLPDMFIAHLKDSTPQANGQSDLRHLFAYDPDRSKHLLEFTQAVMRLPGPLSPGERELIAAMTSRDNQCLF